MKMTVHPVALPATAAKLAWLAKIEEPNRDAKVKWNEATRARVTRHYRTAMKQSPTAARAIEIERLREAFRRTRPENATCGTRRSKPQAPQRPSKDARGGGRAIIGSRESIAATSTRRSRG